MGNFRQLRERLSQQRRFIAVTRCGDERCDHVAIPVTEDDSLVTLEFL
jgi:hypothetical protein